LHDGRKHHHARVAAVVTTALTTIGLGIATASPASASPDINEAKSRVDRLSQQAEVANRRHDHASTSLTGARDAISSLTRQIRHQQQVLDSLRAQVASSVTDTYDATGGTTAPSSVLAKDSELLLTNVTLVSEDTGLQGDEMADSNVQLQQLTERRAAVRDQIASLARLEQTLQQRQRQVDTRVSRAGSRLASMQREAEAKRMRELGGPVLAYAKSKVGNSYVWGAAGPSSFDCSGLTMMAWQQAGVSLPHSSTAQYNSGKHVSESELQPGDLVFYYSPISHVGLYIGNGQIVNALNPGTGVKISGLHDMPYVGAVRPD